MLSSEFRRHKDRACIREDEDEEKEILSGAHAYDNVGTKELGFLRNHLSHIEGLGLPENTGFHQTWKRRF